MLQGWDYDKRLAVSDTPAVATEVSSLASMWPRPSSTGFLRGFCRFSSASNDAVGFGVLWQDLRDRQINLIVVETTEGAKDALISFLIGQGLSVSVNPRAAREFARSQDHPAGPDAIDAKALSHYAHTLAHKANQAGCSARYPYQSR